MASTTATAMVKANKEVKKVTLWERFKNYLIENVDIIAPGIISLCSAICGVSVISRKSAMSRPLVVFSSSSSSNKKSSSIPITYLFLVISTKLLPLPAKQI